MAGNATIFAVSSGKGRAGVAVIRISGPRAGEVARALSGKPPPPPRRAVVRTLRDPADRALPLDRALLLFFAGPASFTGEDVLELHVHGGRAVMDAVIAALAALPGLRPAGPGEFTRRAFENGKLDLTAAEGLGDLIGAETEAQRRQALRQMSGALGALYEGWRERLLSALAAIEAEIDFPDEEVPEAMVAQVAPGIARVRDEIAAHLDDAHRGERLRDGARIVILGPPNVGKSSLLNALAQREAAIVAAEAGTTRDIIELAFDLGGYPASLVDTAGLREAGNAVEAEGVRRALARAAAADLRVLVVDAAAWPQIPHELVAHGGEGAVLVANKVDLVEEMEAGALDAEGAAFAVSAKTGAGLDALLAHLETRVVALCDVGEAPAITRARHREALEACAQALAGFFAEGEDAVLAAEAVRLATRELGRITGRVDVEDVLDRLFAGFCIGK